MQIANKAARRSLLLPRLTSADRFEVDFGSSVSRAADCDSDPSHSLAASEKVSRDKERREEQNESHFQFQLRLELTRSSAYKRRQSSPLLYALSSPIGANGAPQS